MKRIIVFFLLSFLILFSLPAWEFGVLLNQEAGGGGIDSDGNFDYAISLVPRLTLLIGDTGDFIISGAFEADYNEGWGCVPELLVTEFTYHTGSWAFGAGRMQHSDPLGFIAFGLFDGAKLALDTEAGNFSAGAWYTGLLYKKRANIEMTADEYEANNAPLDYGDLSGTYFAPRRFLAALAWEHLGWAVQSRASLIGQFDFFEDEPLNSQYAAVKFTLPKNAFTFDLGGCLELLENNGETNTAFAAEAGIAYVLPTQLKSRLSLLARYSSGDFLPLTTISQGDILQAKLSGLSVFSLDYVIRLHQTFSAGLTSTCFVLNDSAAYTGYPADKAGKGSILGNEFYGRFLWSPASDLYVNLGAGVFLPSLGNAAPDAGSLWRVEINVVFALF